MPNPRRTIGLKGINGPVPTILSNLGQVTPAENSVSNIPVLVHRMPRSNPFSDLLGRIVRRKVCGYPKLVACAV